MGFAKGSAQPIRFKRVGPAETRDPCARAIDDVSHVAPSCSRRSGNCKPIDSAVNRARDYGSRRVAGDRNLGAEREETARAVRFGLNATGETERHPNLFQRGVYGDGEGRAGDNPETERSTAIGPP